MGVEDSYMNQNFAPFQNNMNYPVNQNNRNFPSNQNNQVSFRCIYLIQDTNNYTRLINDRGKICINPEISYKVKILKDNKRENLIFQRKFDKTGLYTIDYIIEGTLTNMSFMFNECTSLKQIEFISCDTSQVIDMKYMFRNCFELECIDLSNFNTIML